MSKEKTSRKFGSVAYATGFAFIIAGSTLFQLVLRDYVPHGVDGGWFDYNRTIAAAVVGGVSGLIGALIGYGIERLLRA